MNINIDTAGNKTTIYLEGRLDTTTAPALDNAINGLSADITELVIDMNKLEYISSAGLRVLLSTQKKMNKIGYMKITGVCEDIMEIFEMTGFTDILTIE